MKKLAILAAAMLGAAIATPAMAQTGDTGVYAGVGYTQLDADEVDIGGVTGRLGYRFHPNFGVEGEMTFGLDEDTADNLGTPVDVELDEQWGVYGVGFVPVTENIEVFGRVGYVNVDAAATVGGFTAGVDEDGIGYGAGVQWAFNERFALRADYTRLSGEDEGANAWGLTGVYQF